MTRNEWARLLFGIALLVALGAWFVTTFEWVDEKVPGAMQGEALRDPHYAARLLLERLGHKTQVITEPGELLNQPTQATLVAVNLFPESVAARIEDGLVNWVKQGGHLVVVVPSPKQSSRFTTSLGLQRLGLHTPKHDEALKLEIEGRQLEADITACDVFSVKQPLLWSASVTPYSAYANEDSEDAATCKPDAPPALALARWSLGQGTVTALCNDYFLDNSVIGKHANAELSVRVLLDGRDGPIIFVPHAEYPSLPEWLAEHAWAALTVTLILLGLTLWSYVPRFGPIAPEPAHARPGLREHLRAMARFQLKKGHYAYLLQANRELVLRLAERHTGSSEINLADIALLAGVSEHDLRQAFEFDPEDRTTYATLAEVLAQVSDALKSITPSSLPLVRSRKP